MSKRDDEYVEGSGGFLTPLSPPPNQRRSLSQKRVSNPSATESQPQAKAQRPRVLQHSDTSAAIRQCPVCQCDLAGTTIEAHWELTHCRPVVFRESKRPSRLGSLTTSKDRSRLSSGKGSRIQCGICGARLQPKLLSDHVRQVHGAHATRTQPKASTGQEGSASSAQSGRVLKTFAELRAYAKRVAPSGSLNREAPGAQAPMGRGHAEAGHKLVPCPSCRQCVRADRLSRHQAKVHGVPERDGPRRGSTGGKVGTAVTGPGKRVPIDPARADREKVDENTGARDPRDASKYVGHQFRETGGRFGSHPIHDGYDDESDPS